MRPRVSQESVPLGGLHGFIMFWDFVCSESYAHRLICSALCCCVDTSLYSVELSSRLYTVALFDHLCTYKLMSSSSTLQELSLSHTARISCLLVASTLPAYRMIITSSSLLLPQQVIASSMSLSRVLRIDRYLISSYRHHSATSLYVVIVRLDPWLRSVCIVSDWLILRTA